MAEVEGLHVNLTADDSSFQAAFARQRASLKKLATDQESLAAAFGHTTRAANKTSKSVDKLGDEFSALKIPLAASKTEMLGVGSAASRSGARLSALGRGMRAMRGQTQAVSFQLQDIIVQMAAGTSWTVALGQNVPQLASAFGKLGAVIGLAAAVAFPAIAISMKLFTKNSKAVSDELEKATAALQSYEKASDAAEVSTDELRTKFGDLADTIKTGNERVAAAEKAALIKQIRSAFQTINDELQAGFGATRMGEGYSIFEDLFDVNMREMDAELRDRFTAMADRLSIYSKALQSVNISYKEQLLYLNALQAGVIRMAAVSGERSEEEQKFIDLIQTQIDSIEQLAANSDEVKASVRETAAEQAALTRQADASRAAWARYGAAWEETLTNIRKEREVSLAVQVQENMISDEVRKKHIETFEAAKKLRKELGTAAHEMLVMSGIDITSNISSATKEAAKLAASLGIALSAAMSLMNMRAGMVYGEVGARGDPRDYMKGGKYSYEGNNPRDITFGTNIGGGGGENPLIAQIEQLKEALMTEKELLTVHYQEQQETLRAAWEQRLITQQEFQNLALESTKQYTEKRAQIQAEERDRTLGHYATFFRNMATVTQVGGKKLVAFTKAFSIAEGLLNSYRAFTQIIADNTIPPFLRTALAYSTLAAGLAQVANMRSVNYGSGGGGGGTTTSGTPVSDSGGRQSSRIALQLSGGDMFSRDQVLELINKINEAQEDGAFVRLV